MDSTNQPTKTSSHKYIENSLVYVNIDGEWQIGAVCQSHLVDGESEPRFTVKVYEYDSSERWSLLHDVSGLDLRPRFHTDSHVEVQLVGSWIAARVIQSLHGQKYEIQPIYERVMIEAIANAIYLDKSDQTLDRTKAFDVAKVIANDNASAKAIAEATAQARVNLSFIPMNDDKIVFARRKWEFHANDLRIMTGKRLKVSSRVLKIRRNAYATVIQQIVRGFIDRRRVLKLAPGPMIYLDLMVNMPLICSMTYVYAKVNDKPVLQFSSSLDSDPRNPRFCFKLKIDLNNQSDNESPRPNSSDKGN
jgi:hypothetical protein